MIKQICDILVPVEPPLPPAWPLECSCLIGFLALLVAALAAFAAVARERARALSAENTSMLQTLEELQIMHETTTEQNQRLKLALDRVRLSLCKNEKEDDWGSIFELRDLYSLPASSDCSFSGGDL